MTTTATRLMYSKANQAFVFTFGGEQLLRIGNGPMFYRNKADAIRAALQNGLLVDTKGHVTAVDTAAESSEGEVLSGLEGAASLRTPVGTKVRFKPNPGSYQLYSNPPEDGEEGEVTTVAHIGGRRSSMKGPGGGLLYIKWDRTGTQGVAPQDVEVLSKSRKKAERREGVGLSEWEGEFKSLTYGVLPSRAEFVKRTEGQYPYPMELVGEDKDVVLDLGINLNKDGIEEFDSEYAHKMGVRVLNAEAMYRFLIKLKDKHDSGENEENNAAGGLASSILYTLGYEWV